MVASQTESPAAALIASNLIATCAHVFNARAQHVASSGLLMESNRDGCFLSELKAPVLGPGGSESSSLLPMAFNMAGTI